MQTNVLFVMVDVLNDALTSVVHIDVAVTLVIYLLQIIKPALVSNVLTFVVHIDVVVVFRLWIHLKPIYLCI